MRVSRSRAWVRACARAAALAAILAAAPGSVRPDQAEPNSGTAGIDSGLRASDRSRRVTVGFYDNKPKVYTDESGRPAGIFVEILDEIARRENWELAYVKCAWPECLTALASGEVDLVPDMAYSAERDAVYDFHAHHVLESWSQVYVRHGVPIERLSDLSGRRIALLEGSIQETALPQMMSGFGYEVTLIPTRSYEEAFRLAAEGSVDAAVTNHFFGSYYHRNYGLDETAVVLSPVSLYYVTSQGRHSELLSAIDRQLSSMKAESGSVFYRAVARWLDRPPSVVVPRYVKWVLGGVGASLLTAFGIILLLRRRVRLQTNHLAQASATLAESEKKYRELFETMAQGVVCQDSQGIVVAANPAAERILGVPLSAGQRLRVTDPGWSAVREDGSPMPLEDLPGAVALRTGTAVSGVTVGIRFPGVPGTRWILVDAIPVRVPGYAEPVQVHSMFSDITARKQAEDALQDQHRELQQVFATLPDALIYADVNQRIVTVNPAFVELFGYTPAEVVGEDAVMLQGAPREDKAAGESGPSETSCDPSQIEYRRSDGTTFTGETVGSAIRDSQGRVVGMLSLVRDVTDRCRLEAELRQAQKMESVGRLAGGVAHDFNNLLCVMLGLGETVLDELPPDSPHRDSLTQIVGASLRARNLTRQLLAFSRRQVLDMRPVNVNDVISGFQSLLRRMIGEDIALKLSLAPEPCRVVADTGQLEQVLLNLAANARDAMPTGGTLMITTALTELDEVGVALRPETAPGQYVLISFADTGFGMDKETVQHVFEPFFTTKGKDKGTGLGLATSYGIIKQHGGSIGVYSEPGTGTTFNVYLPMRAEDAAAVGLDTAHPGRLEGTETILLVEDNDQVRNLARSILSGYGYSVLSAENGEAALALLVSHGGPLDLVLTDVVMPGINGKELFERVAARHPQTRVLYMSGYAGDLVSHRGVLKDGVHFLQKPFSRVSLAAKVRSVLDEHRKMSAPH